LARLSLARRPRERVDRVVARLHLDSESFLEYQDAGDPVVRTLELSA